MYSESTSIPKNPRTDRPVGYAFVDLSTSGEADRAIAELSGKEILERKVSVQLARKPEPAGEKAEGANGGDTGSGGENGRRRTGPGRGRGRGRGRNPRGGRGNRGVCNSSPTSETVTNLLPQNREDAPNEEGAEVTTSEVLPLTDITNQAPADKEAKDAKPARPAREPRERRERGPPADGIPSKVKVMVANLPYDLTEDKVRPIAIPHMLHR